MDWTSIGVIVTIIIGLVSGATFILHRVSNKSKHETVQDSRLESIEESRRLCVLERKESTKSLVKRIEQLENKDHDKDLVLISINEKIESLHQGHDHTQAILGTIQETIQENTINQQKIFTQLIDVIKDIKKG